MKIRNGFVSNSSSCAFIITNRSNEKKKLSDFVEEVGRKVLREVLENYDWFNDDDKMNFNELMNVAKGDRYDYVWKPKEAKECIFGDEQRNKLGLVFDYGLRNGGTSKNWMWRLEKYLR